MTEPGEDPLKNIDITGLPLKVPIAPVQMQAFESFARQHQEMTERIVAPLIKATAQNSSAVTKVNQIMQQVAKSNAVQIQASLGPFFDAMSEQLRSFRSVQLVPAFEAMAAVIAEHADHVHDPDVEIAPATGVESTQLDVLIVMVAYAALVIFGTQMWRGLAAGDRDAALTALGEALMSLLVLRETTK